jgi:dihydrodipicolinate synthase/N-acetylneuraminate lyase
MAEDLVKQNIGGIYLNGLAGECLSITVTDRKKILNRWMNTKETR